MRFLATRVTACGFSIFPGKSPQISLVFASPVHLNVGRETSLDNRQSDLLREKAADIEFTKKASGKKVPLFTSLSSHLIIVAPQGITQMLIWCHTHSLSTREEKGGERFGRNVGERSIGYEAKQEIKHLDRHMKTLMETDWLQRISRYYMLCLFRSNR